MSDTKPIHCICVYRPATTCAADIQAAELLHFCCCRLASGDSSRGVVVWDVFTASPVARLEDVHAARELLKEYAGRVASNGNALAAGTTSTGDASSIGVASLAWVLPNFSMLAVVMSPGLLMLWDVAGKSQLKIDM